MSSLDRPDRVGSRCSVPGRRTIAAAFLEEVIADGGRSFIAVGATGALLPNLVLGHPVIWRASEGTPFHHATPRRGIDPDQAGVTALRDALDTVGVDNLTGRT